MLGLSGWGRASILLLVAALVLAVGSSYSMASPTEQTATLGGGIPPTVFALTAVAQRADPAAAGRDEPWPPFTMTFQETTHEHLGSATTRTQRVRVGYTVRRQFTTTLLADSAVPQSVGMMPTFNGQTTVHHRPGFPDVVTQWARADRAGEMASARWHRRTPQNARVHQQTSRHRFGGGQSRGDRARVHPSVRGAGSGCHTAASAASAYRDHLPRG